MGDVASSDRRRTPCALVSGTALSVLAFPIPLGLLGISLTGVLLESSHPVDLGSCGTLRFNFGGVLFSTDRTVERIDRSHFTAGADRDSIGAAFVALSHQDQRVIERFARQ